MQEIITEGYYLAMVIGSSNNQNISAQPTGSQLL